MDAAKPFWQSKTLLGVVVALLPLFARRLGLELSDADTQALAGDVVTMLGAALAAYGRVTAKSGLHR